MDLLTQFTLLAAVMSAAWAAAWSRRLLVTVETVSMAIATDGQGSMRARDLHPTHLPPMMMVAVANACLAVAFAFLDHGLPLALVVQAVLYGMYRLALYQLPPPAGVRFTQVLHRSLALRQAAHQERGQAARADALGRVLARMRAMENKLKARRPTRGNRI
jgi:hypothetical protein